jgi:hypothetical protein
MRFTCLAAIVAMTCMTSPIPLRGADEKPDASKDALSPGLPAGLKEQTRPLFDGSSLDGWLQIPADSWEVKAGTMASLGAGRGVIYTKDNYAKFRLVFIMRHVRASSKRDDHQPCVLIFCTRPEKGKKPLDALGGIQFQPPNGGHWDYRPGHNKAGKGFTSPSHPKFSNKEWFQVELLVDAAAGTARMAVAQPPGAKAAEVLSYKDPAAGRTGPIAFQMHNKGLFDEVKDVRIETDPKADELVTTK